MRTKSKNVFRVRLQLCVPVLAALMTSQAVMSKDHHVNVYFKNGCPELGTDVHTPTVPANGSDKVIWHGIDRDSNEPITTGYTIYFDPFKDGKPLISFSVQGGDLQDQNSLQFFLNMVEWDMNIQHAAEGQGNLISYQMQSSFGAHESQPGRIQLAEDHVTPYTRKHLEAMGYNIEILDRVYNPMMGIWFDWENGQLKVSFYDSSQKMKNLRNDPRMSASIVDPADGYRYVEIRGVAVSFEPDTDMEFITRMAGKYLGLDHFPWHEEGQVEMTVTIDPTRIVGMGT